MRRKIVLPFMLLFLAGFGALIGVALYESARQVEERVLAEVRSLARVYAQQPDLLINMADRVAEVLRASGVVYAKRGHYFWSAAGSSTGTPPYLVNALCKKLEYEETVLNSLGTDEEYVVALVYMPQDHALFVAYHADALRQEKLAAMKPLILVSAIGLLVVCAVGFWLAHTLTKPLAALVERTEALAKGDLERKVEVSSRDEIGRLARSFNAMTDALRVSQDERVRAEKLAALGQVTAGIAHEIRNPLTAMKMTLQLLLEQEPAGDRRESLSVVLKETERLAMTIDGLLAYAKPPALALAQGDLNAVARGAAEVLDAQVKHLGVTLELRLEYVPLVRIDAARMHQVVVNLLLNAVQAAGAGGTVTLATSSDAKKVSLSVTDSGAGIAEEARPRIFEPFFTTKTGGIGLGLAVSRRLVEDHGGVLRFDGAPGRTTFHVEVPIA